MPTDQRSADDAYELDLPRAGFIGLVKVRKDRTAPYGPPPPELLQALTDADLALEASGSGWRLAVEAGTHPFVIPVDVTFQRPAGGAFPNLGSLADFVSHIPESVRLVGEVMLVPTPGHKGHASVSPPRRRHFTRGDLDRVPVAVVAPKPPPRRSRDELRGQRRPVVALLDTKVDEHKWLGPPDPELGGDGFWVDAGSLGWEPGPRLSSPIPHEELGEGEGHGTFSAGLIRQVAPDVQVLAVHAMPDDEGVYGDHILNALAWLAGGGGPALKEDDVICLPACFRPQLPTDATFLDWLGQVLARLAHKKVRVVAAAGNDGSDDPVYPAAFAVATGGPANGVQHVSVGALNPDGDKKILAYFSNYGDWVTAREIGTSLVSTFPKINRAAAPELVADGRRSTDPDDFTSGFARWSGTSFAAAIHAGNLTQGELEAAIGADG